jgi:hypothetical protein
MVVEQKADTQMQCTFKMSSTHILKAYIKMELRGGDEP